jgi:hypothetical protein
MPAGPPGPQSPLKDAMKRQFWIKLALLAGLGNILPAVSQATDLLDWQPCPDLLARADAPEPAADQRWTFTAAPLVFHWGGDDPARKYAFVLALERQVAGQRFCGLSLFRNSFGQASGYLYAGQRWDTLWGNPDLSLKISAGIIYGYTGEESDKVPYNWNGFSPAIIPSFVYHLSPAESLDLMILGTAGVVFAYSRNF